MRVHMAPPEKMQLPWRPRPATSASQINEGTRDLGGGDVLVPVPMLSQPRPSTCSLSKNGGFEDTQGNSGEIWMREPGRQSQT